MEDKDKDLFLLELNSHSSSSPIPSPVPQNSTNSVSVPVLIELEPPCTPKSQTLAKDNQVLSSTRPLLIYSRKKVPIIQSMQIQDSELAAGNEDATGSTSTSTEQDQQANKHLKLGHSVKAQPISHNYFDGASKGNPGKAGAGAILRTEDGTVISRLREGLGVVTNNVAEYRALILGMKYALKKGFKQIRVQGDSNLVCMQVQDLWQTKNQNMANLCKEAKGLKDMFLSFKISHVRREFNSDADAQANLAVDLPVGKVCDEPGELC
ncbi:uncharacterized protein LOC103723714 isoform X2 [Phoenix dactylifera]|uniref:Uncharacterized protein LOC103723714 isoform X2 n=1 Tax=Phoenix dactylifera TaxID=42345 RepID=A0A8B9AB96_PHODC|nr:uncharacterized protein LOC103723714 isoform X2 [Phoenix dactylifera]